MKLPRAAYEPAELLAFYEEGLTSLGALCERTWHDRLEVVAEGAPARLWNAENRLHEVELHFASADAASAREAAREVFPGCPLTFQLAEALRPPAVALECFLLPAERGAQAPAPPVAEKRWRAQFPQTTAWQLTVPFRAGLHFSVVELVRCEIQAIDQHWSLHRLAVSLPSGAPDEELARDLAFAQHAEARSGSTEWPAAEPTVWQGFLQQALRQEFAEDLTRITTRQEVSLRQELNRIDDYFQQYGHELSTRAQRSTSAAGKTKQHERLAAAEAEHQRRRADQISRHEIRVVPHLDALLLIAEHAWHTQIRTQEYPASVAAHYIERARRWEIEPPV